MSVASDGDELTQAERSVNLAGCNCIEKLEPGWVRGLRRGF